MAPRLRLRLRFDDGAYIGPGKADLLALIAETGSISAAAARMGMSYKRAWSLVEVLNAMFAAPLVASVRGGAHGGGAHLTETGKAVLATYGAMQANADAAAATDIAKLLALRALASRTCGSSS
ncbi:MAG: LysR family transcriptional regulator [Rhodobacteraceae bacterium]|nr:LysR family transcriptional regulator [Paracoccaceae bacterium]